MAGMLSEHPSYLLFGFVVLRRQLDPAYRESDEANVGQVGSELRNRRPHERSRISCRDIQSNKFISHRLRVPIGKMIVLVIWQP